MVWSPPPTEDQCREAFRATQTFPRTSDAARAIGKTATCLKWRVNLYHERGLVNGAVASAPKAAPLDNVERPRT